MTLVVIEKEYSYEAISEVRQRYENLIEFEERMKLEESKVK